MYMYIYIHSGTQTSRSGIAHYVLASQTGSCVWPRFPSGASTPTPTRADPHLSRPPRPSCRRRQEHQHIIGPAASSQRAARVSSTADMGLTMPCTRQTPTPARGVAAEAVGSPGACPSVRQASRSESAEFCLDRLLRSLFLPFPKSDGHRQRKQPRSRQSRQAQTERTCCVLYTSAESNHRSRSKKRRV